MSLNFGNLTRSQDTSNFLTKTDAKLQTELNMNDYKIINLPSPENDNDGANKSKTTLKFFNPVFVENVRDQCTYSNGFYNNLNYHIIPDRVDVKYLR